MLPYVLGQMSLGASVSTYPRGTIFEKRSIEDRQTYLYSALWLLLDWPDRFISACKHLDLSSAYLSPDFPQVPYWFDCVLEDKLNNSVYSPTNREILETGNWLMSQGIEPTRAAISRVLGYTPLRKRDFTDNS